MGQWDPGLYAEKHSFVWEKAKGLLDLLAPQEGEHILDLGCGTGQFTAQIAASGAHVTGVDRSAEMVGEARKKFPALQFEVCDARNLHFDSQFDAVFSNAVLHWVLEAAQVAAGVARALKPGGRFVAEFGGKGNVQAVVSALETALTQMGLSASGANPWYYPSISEYSGVLETHGLEVMEAALFDRPTQLDAGEQGLENWVTMFCVSYVERVREARRPEYIRLVEEAARPALWRDGHWVLDYRRLRIAARKSRL